MSEKDGKKMTNFLAQIKQGDLQTLKEMCETGKIVPLVEKVYPLEETPQAVRYLGSGHARAKLVIRVDGS